MNELSSSQKHLYKEIAKILWEQWDPIGVNDGENEWDDEYDSYVPHTFRLAIENRDATKIASYLSSVVNENIGLASDIQHDFKIAKIILKAKSDIFGE